MRLNKKKITFYMEHHHWRINHKGLKIIQSQTTQTVFVPKFLCLQSTVNKPEANTHRVPS